MGISPSEEPVYSHALMVTGSRSWDDEKAVRRALNHVWALWAKEGAIARPVLLSGRCPTGADAIAERVWVAAGFEVIGFPADWARHDRSAGPERNRSMVSALTSLRGSGAQVDAVAFLDLCTRPGCPHRKQEQLAPAYRGHFSHGTVHARWLVCEAGVRVFDEVRQRGVSR